MNAAARELGRLAGAIAHQRAREPILERARQLCREMGRPIPPALNPEIILTRADRVEEKGA